MILSLSYYSDIGKRKNNEDAVSVSENANGLLAIVCDGLGGMANGEYASQQAVKTVTEALTSAAVSRDALEAAVIKADQDVHLLQSRHPGALTTVAALWLCGQTAVAMHVGDTRIYQLRGDCVIFQSRDHSLAQLAVIAGELKPEEIRTHKERNKLCRVLGTNRRLQVEDQFLEVQSGDRFLLCSDGFWEKIDEEEMVTCALATENAESWLQRMRAIVQPSARDNHTAVAIVVN